MPDLLNTSLSGMLAFQRALDLTGNNIANANTPGYSRQVAEFTSRVGGGAGNLYIGGGTQITTIKRMYDSLLVDQLRTAATGQARYGMLEGLAGRIDTLLADPDTGINTGLQNFFNTVQDVANDPASIPIRQALLGEADSLVARFTGLDSKLDTLESELNQRLDFAVNDINRLASGIAELNDRIALAGVEAQPNDLLDQRDQLVLELSGLVAVQTTNQDDGALNVFIGSGQSLVLGTNVQRLGAQGSEYDPTRLEVVYEGSSGSTPIDDSLTGGTLGGLLEFRSRMLDPARQSLGRTAVAFAAQFNTQHSLGMDLRGNLGGDLFSIADPSVLPSNRNTGTPSVQATISDLGGLTGADYELSYDGSAYSLTRTDTGAAIALSGSGTPADPFVADGLSIEVGGAPAAGDSVLIRSGVNAAGSLQRLISDPQALALASPVRAEASLSNVGEARVTNVGIINRDDPNLLTPSTIRFLTPNSYTLDGTTAISYLPGAPIIVNGKSVTIEGSPEAGDEFVVEPNFGASGDNSNALQLANVQAVGILDGGTISINESYAQLVSSVGSTTNQIQSGLDAQNVIYKNAEDAVLSKSAVNLDEEAANLIRYQQAYQAAAQVVNVTKTLFDSLLAATRR